MIRKMGSFNAELGRELLPVTLGLVLCDDCGLQDANDGDGVSLGQDSPRHRSKCRFTCSSTGESRGEGPSEPESPHAGHSQLRPRVLGGGSLTNGAQRGAWGGWHFLHAQPLGALGSPGHGRG